MVGLLLLVPFKPLKRNQKMPLGVATRDSPKRAKMPGLLGPGQKLGPFSDSLVGEIRTPN